MAAVAPTPPPTNAPSSSESSFTPSEASSLCVESLKAMAGKFAETDLVEACQAAAIFSGCASEQQRPIFHFDKSGSDPKGKRILALSLIHGDELPSGTVARAWMTRLNRLSPRNTWRVIPVVNPDGLKKGTRTNSRGVDVNRNFPTKAWDDEALQKWKSVTNEDPRRYPGPHAASESETRCMMKHIDDFKPDFIVSIHTPLGVLDFDGPKVDFPQFKPLPWISLGNFPGSLGRYMWKDHNVPVLTIELKGPLGVRHLEQFDQLQDISGTVAIQANEAKSKSTNKD